MTIRITIKHEGEAIKSDGTPAETEPLYVSHYDPTGTIFEPSNRVDIVPIGSSIELTIWDKNFLTLSNKKLTK